MYHFANFDIGFPFYIVVENRVGRLTVANAGEYSGRIEIYGMIFFFRLRAG
jgi:hypothetical protein